MSFNSNTWIYELGLSNRATNALERSEIYTLQQLLTLSEEELFAIRGIGATVVKEILSFLENVEVSEFEDDNAVENEPEISIKTLNLSNRTENALINNNIYTLKQLYSLTPQSLLCMRGIGVTTFNEIKELIISHGENLANDSKKYTISEYLRKIAKNERNIELVVEYYNAQPSITYQDLADRYGLTRSRVGQVIVKYARKIGEAVERNAIEDDIVEKIEKAATVRAEIHNLNIQDETFSDSGIAFLISDFKPKKYKVFYNGIINGYWLTHVDDNVEKIISDIHDRLRYDNEPLVLTELQEHYSISCEMILSIKGTIEKDGFITHEKNGRVTGTNKTFLLEQYLESINRPASITEMSANTGLEIGMIRSALNHTRIFKNVGKSVYDLVARDYDELSIGELARNILTAEDRPLKVEYVVDYIRRYKYTISKSSIMGYLFNDPGLRYEKERIFLCEWPSSKLVKQAKGKYFIRLEDAVLSILEDSDEVFDFEKTSIELKKYEGMTSMNPSSIKSTLSRLADKHLINRVANGVYHRKERTDTNSLNWSISQRLGFAKFIDSHKGQTIDIRYKTSRENSDKRWRTISVRDQDSRYIYTGDCNIYGHEIKYVKDKVVEYK